MMNILKKSGDLSAVEIYFMTEASNSEKVTDHVGETIEYTAYVLYETEDSKTGDTIQVLSLMQPTDIAIVTNSATFIKSFFKMVDLFTGLGAADELQYIKILSDTSKGGRTYVDCVFVDPKKV